MENRVSSALFAGFQSHQGPRFAPSGAEKSADASGPSLRMRFLTSFTRRAFDSSQCRVRCQSAKAFMLGR